MMSESKVLQDNQVYMYIVSFLLSVTRNAREIDTRLLTKQTLCYMYVTTMRLEAKLLRMNGITLQSESGL